MRTVKCMDPFPMFRRNSRGYMRDPPAKLHTKILFGPGCMLTEKFVEEKNITHIINCASEADTPSWIPNYYNKNYVCLNSIDSLNVDITRWYEGFKNAMDKFLHDEDCGTVFVHCQAGMNRSGFLTVLYCCMKFGYEYEKVCKAALLQRPCALTNSTFHSQVKEYIKKHR